MPREIKEPKVRIDTVERARNALANQKNNAAKQETVKRRVYAKYPFICKEK